MTSAKDNIKCEVLTMQGEKAGLIGGAIGTTIGGTSWLIILGISMKSILLATVPVLWGLVGVIAVIKFYDINPERKFLIIGAGILWIVVLNFILGNILYDKIPDTLAGMSTGKDQFSLLQINIFLGLISLLGFYFILRDIFETRNS